MKRKIVQHGSSSLTVTLPVKWADKYKLKKGDEVNVDESGPILMVSTEQETSSPKKEVTTTQFGIFTKNNLSHLYQLGYDELEIRYDTNETLEDIKKRVQNCIGYEIIDQKDHKVYIKSIATTLESEFDNLLRKAFLIVNEMSKSIIEKLEEGDITALQDIRNMEALNNKFTDVCIRILSKRGYKIPNRTMQAHNIVKCVEEICDELKYVCDIIMQNGKISFDTDIIKIIKESATYYNTFYELFYKFNPELKKTIYQDRKRLNEKISEAMKKSHGAKTLVLHHCLNFVQKTYNAAGGYFALSL